MPPIIPLLENHELRRFNPGEIVLEEGTTTGLLFILAEGAVEVIKNGTQVATTAEPGAVFGELSALLGTTHTATVRASQPSAFYVVRDPRAALEAAPQLCLHVCELLARRLDALNRYVVDVQQQFEGHDHIGMVDGVLETLMHRQPRARIRPSASTIAQTELTD
jgi:CRP-like cAMP-binding protein